MNPLLWRDTLLEATNIQARYDLERAIIWGVDACSCQVCGFLRGEHDPVSSDLLCSRCRIRYSVARWLVWGER